MTSHGHLDHIGGLVTKSGPLAFPKAEFVFVNTEWNYWTGSRYVGTAAVELTRPPLASRT